MPAENSHEALTRAVLAVFRANGALLAWGDRFAQAEGLTSARWQMLGALALAGEPLAAPRIAEVMGVTRQGAQKQLDLLVEERLVERLANPGNARSPLYRLSRRGASTYARIDRRWQQRARILAGRLGAEDTAATRRFLSRLLDELAADA
jgi:DNA-binding MarR family transcriptional regulator